MRKNEKGFTLVELLAVIVILAIILVIAVPQIMKTIDESREGALASSAKLIAASAEREYLVRQTIGDTDFDPEEVEMECDEVAETTSDYSRCSITFNNGKAYVSLVGAGKFAGKYVCNATRNNAVISDTECTGGSGGSGEDDNTETGAAYIENLYATAASSNGLYANDPDNNVRYAGANDVVKNNIWFNCVDTDASGNSYGTTGYEYNNTNCELWRIIGVFDGRIKIVRNENLPEKDSFDNVSNVWSDSELAQYLNGDYYNSLSLESKAEIDESVFYIGVVSAGTADSVYSNERTETTETQNKIGLIYPSDFGYAGANCVGNVSLNDSVCGATDNWLTPSNNWYWTISPQYVQTYYNGWAVNSEGVITEKAVYIDHTAATRPALYLSSNVEITSGDGTSGASTTNNVGPYVIKKMAV